MSGPQSPGDICVSMSRGMCVFVCLSDLTAADTIFPSIHMCVCFSVCAYVSDLTAADAIFPSRATQEQEKPRHSRNLCSPAMLLGLVASGTDIKCHC